MAVKEKYCYNNFTKAQGGVTGISNRSFQQWNEDAGKISMLTGKQRRFLRAMGTVIEPIIHIGKAGLAAPVVQQLAEALEARELVKIRVIANSPVESKSIGPQLAEAADAELVQSIGRNLLFYRRSATKPVIELP